MDLKQFGPARLGNLTPIRGTDPRSGSWEHAAFLPNPLPTESPTFEGPTHRAIANARAALASLDSTARQLPNPRLLRRPALRTEAQSTSALEGTYVPLADVLTADGDRPGTPDLREVLNYVNMAERAFTWVENGHPLTVGLLGELQQVLVCGTQSENSSSGRIRDIQVVVGRRADALADDLPVTAARFVPPPPGIDLESRVRDLLDWIETPRLDKIDPVVAAAMAHYQFEALHPFGDGNGRIGRLFIVVHLLKLGVLSEPTLTVSPWFEARRGVYYDHLLAVSANGSWDPFIRFFADGLQTSAIWTQKQILALVDVQGQLKEIVRGSRLRADTAHTLVDYAVGHPIFTVKEVERDLKISYARANGLVDQLVNIKVLASLDEGGSYRRRFFAPSVLKVLMSSSQT